MKLEDEIHYQIYHLTLSGKMELDGSAGHIPFAPEDWKWVQNNALDQKNEKNSFDALKQLKSQFSLLQVVVFCHGDAPNCYCYNLSVESLLSLKIHNGFPVALHEH